VIVWRCSRILGLLKMFGPKGEEVAGGCRKLHNGELHDWYSTLNTISLMKSKKMRCERHVARIGKKKNGYRIGKPEGKRPNTMEGLGIDGSLLKMDLEKMGWVDMDGGRTRCLTNEVMTYCSIKCGEFLSAWDTDVGLCSMELINRYVTVRKVYGEILKPFRI